MNQKIKVLVTGIPSVAAWMVAEAVSNSQYMELLPCSLASSESFSNLVVIGGEPLMMLRPSNQKVLLEFSRPDVVIDFLMVSDDKQKEIVKMVKEKNGAEDIFFDLDNDAFARIKEEADIVLIVENWLKKNFPVIFGDEKIKITKKYRLIQIEQAELDWFFCSIGWEYLFLLHKITEGNPRPETY